MSVTNKPKSMMVKKPKLIYNNKMTDIKVYLKSNILWLYLAVIFFKLFGLAPFNINTSITRKIIKQTHLCFIVSRLGVIYNIILSLSFFLITFFLTSFYATHIRLDYLKVLFRTLIFAGRFIAIAIIALIYACQQWRVVAFANRLVAIESELIENLSDIYQHQSGKCRQILILVIYIMTHSINLITQLIKPNNTTGKNNFAAFVLGLSIIQYSFLLIYLQKKISSLNKSLIILANLTNKFPVHSIQFFGIKHNIFISKIILIRKAQRILYEVSCEISEINSWPALLVISLYSIGLTHSVYIFVTETIFFEYSQFILNYINGIFWIINGAYILLILTGCVTQLEIEVCN